MNSGTTADINKVMADAEALHGLYNLFGRGRITEYNFVAMYLRGNLPEYIKRVVRGEE